MAVAYVNADLRYSMTWGDQERPFGEEDSIIAMVPPGLTADGWVNVMGARAFSELALFAGLDDETAKHLHHAEILITRDRGTLKTFGQWGHCDECRLGYETADQAMAYEPDIWVVAALMYFDEGF